jgi:hypothetical protein
MAEKNYSDRRWELKQNLYKLLKEREPEGIPKFHLWNIYSVKVGKVSASYYGIRKMKLALQMFDDMLYEVMENGRPTIRLVEGYTPDGGGGVSDVQIAKVSSSESEESLAGATSATKTKDAADDKKKSASEVRLRTKWKRLCFTNVFTFGKLKGIVNGINT